MPSITASTISVFDTGRYLVSANPEKDTRWRVAFNGLGDLIFNIFLEKAQAGQLHW